jgi:hypothetical protein
MTLQGTKTAIAARVKRMQPGQTPFEPSVRMVLTHSARDRDDGLPVLSPELTSVAQIEYWARQLKAEVDNAADVAKRRLEVASAETKAFTASRMSEGLMQAA